MKKQSITLALLTLLFHWAANAQKAGNIWHFGMGAALDFNSGAPVVTTPSAIFTFEGSASIADADGNLLFYTNGGGRDSVLSGQPGGKIWNRNHEVMYDMGNTEGGGFSSAQSSVIIPKPGAPGQYYLFTMEEVEYYVGGDVPGQPLGRGLSYFEVDMALNGGLGGVTNYQGMILTPSYEGLCAVRHQNGSDYWIIVHNTDVGMAVFPVTAAGVGTPTIYNIVTSGIIKGSPDGQWICSSSGIHPFNNQTGVITDAGLNLDNDFLYYEFSPDSKRLFFYKSNASFGYFNLNTPDIIGSATSFAQLPPFTLVGQMQLAPDGNIYLIESNGSNAFVSVIICPNASPLLNRRIFSFMAGSFPFLGLPNFDNAIFRNDDATNSLNVDLGDDITLCENQTALLRTGITGASYSWSNGAVTDTILISAPGVYAVTVTAPGCALGADTVQVSLSALSLDAGADQTVCTDTPVQLQAVTNGAISWLPADLVADPDNARTRFTGDSSATLVATAVLDDCILSDTLFISLLLSPDAAAQPADTTIEVGESVVLTGAGDGAYLWSPADGLSCTDCPDPTATPDSTTTYLFQVISSNGCADTAFVTVNVTPPDCTVLLPNAFTPNGDSTNDSFQLLGKNVEMRAIAIYNRWGEEVYRGSSAWDGRVDGQDAPSDVYVYAADIRVCGADRREMGQVTLLR